MIRVMLTAVALASSAAALATIPPPVLDEAAKAKAAEAAAKTAYQAKMDAYQLCKVQDRIAAKYKGSHPAEAAQAAAQAASGAAAASNMPVATPATASQGGATPVAAVTNPAPPIPPCADPGPFAYTPAAQKPLESSEAHSPAGNATSPPSVRSESGKMAPAK